MGKKEKVKREAIYFNAQGYELQLENYSYKDSLQTLIKEEFGSYKVDFNKDIIEQYYDMICEKYKEKNTLNLSGKKLCDLLEINNEKLVGLVGRYRPFHLITRPRKDAFTVYADTDKELMKLDYAKRLINVLNESKDHLPNTHLTVYLKTFDRVIKRGARSEFVVNPIFIKN